jgi:membrane-bound metal-dependent hydrolase YbcI (DUF457 family)
MFAINHAATALLVKKKYPQAPLPLLLISVQLIELLWVAFNYLGIEYSATETTVSSIMDVHLVHMPYSHSIISTLIVASIAWLVIRRWSGHTNIAIAVALAIASHVVLDLLTHNQDIAIAPFMDSEMFGLGLYTVPMAAFVAESIYGIVCWWIYRGSGLLLAIIVAFNLGNFTFLNTAIVGPEALLANQPLLLATIVLVQIIVTLGLVGLLGRRDEIW